MAPRPRVLVAIDGPAGAGKSTVARMLADRLGFVLVDTGALYRAVALAASRAGLGFDDETAVAALAAALAQERRVRLVPGQAGAGVRVILDGDDVSLAIRTPEISLGASRVSAITGVREALFAMQRGAGEEGGVVLEGRDIGTVVFPDAEVKFFLTASPDQRATRRHAELREKGQTVTYEDTLADVVKRDRADTERPIAPLRRADDAILVDSSALSIEAVVDTMVEAVRRVERARAGGDATDS